MTNLQNCKICGEKPDSFHVNTSRDSCGWVVECSMSSRDDSSFPDINLIEHRIEVYGKDQKEAEKKWNGLWDEIINNKN